MLNEQMCGIYKITNETNDHFYIGSSSNIERRFKTHWSRLRNNKHDNSHLQRSVNKYGLENFTFEIIDYCNEEGLLNLEQFYIDTLQPEYNICKTAGNTLGYKQSKLSKQKISNSKLGHCGFWFGKILSEETKQKMSKSRLGKVMSEEAKQKISQSRKKQVGANNPKSKKIIQLTQAGEIINEFYGSYEAASVTGLNSSNISKACRGELRQTGGYLWRYA